MPLKLSMIVALDRNGVIGDGKGMPWHLPMDLRYFKRRTQNKIVLMGRKTFESIGRPLPNRTNIVVSRQAHSVGTVGQVPNPGDQQPPSLQWCSSLAEALMACESVYSAHSQVISSEVMVIGGGQIYATLLPYTQCLYLTRVATQAQGSVRFPDVEPLSWRRISTEHCDAYDDNLYACDFEVYERKAKERPYSELISGESDDVQTMV